MLGVEENSAGHTSRRIDATGNTRLTDATSEDRAALQAWIREGMEKKGITPTRLAREIETATTTITKFLNDPNYKFTPSTPVISKLERFFGSPAPRTADFSEPMPVEEAEGARLDTNNLPEALQNAILALKVGRNNVEEWRILGQSLTNLGFYPGDIVLVDSGEYARAGEPVLAMTIAEDGSRRPVFRLNEKPFLMPSSSSPAYRTPLLIDDKAVIVVGPILGKISWRKPQ